jgi:DNA primase
VSPGQKSKLIVNSNIGQACPDFKQRLAPAFIEAVRLANRIEGIASERVNLRRSGTQLVGRCPFHAERSPSFYVHPGKQVYRCHGCGAGGDVFSFVRKQLNCTFRESVTHLAQRAGISDFRPSPELEAKVAAARLQRKRELAFARWRDEHIWAVTDTHRRLGHAATHAENCLRSNLDGEADPVVEEKAWDAIERYTNLGLRIEREGLLDNETLQGEWQSLRGGHVAA